MKFCKKCKAILIALTPQDKETIIFECFGCKEQYPSEAKDTLMYSMEYNKDDTTSQYRFLANAGHMDDNTKIKKKCINCPAQYIKMVITGNNMIITYACSSCDSIWTE